MKEIIEEYSKGFIAAFVSLIFLIILMAIVKDEIAQMVMNFLLWYLGT